MIAYPPYYRQTFSTSVYGYDNGYDSTTQTIPFTYSGEIWGNNLSYWPAKEPEPEPDRKAAELAHKREVSRASLVRARLALQRALDDPRPEIPLADRKRPYHRPRAKKRVCAGSSRYRVLVN